MFKNMSYKDLQSIMVDGCGFSHTPEERYNLVMQWYNHSKRNWIERGLGDEYYSIFIKYGWLCDIEEKLKENGMTFVENSNGGGYTLSKKSERDRALKKYGRTA